MTSEATVIRGGRRLRLSAAGLVPGDLVVLQAGDKVPADHAPLVLPRSARRRVGSHWRILAGGEAGGCSYRGRRPCRPHQHGLRLHPRHKRTGDRRGRSHGRCHRGGEDLRAHRRSRRAEDAPHAQDRAVQSGAPLRHYRPGRPHCRGGHPSRRTGRRHVHGSRGTGCGSHPRRPACGRDHRTRHRGVADGSASGDHPPAARRGDTGGHHGHLLGQDGYAYREPDDRPEGRRRTTRLRADGCGLRSARTTARRRCPGETGAGHRP